MSEQRPGYLGADFSSDTGVTALPYVECRTPATGEIIRLRPSQSLEVYCSKTRDQFVIQPGKLPAENTLKPQLRVLHIAVNLQGDVFLWPTPAGQAARKLKGLLRDAEDCWVQVRWDGKASSYRHQIERIDDKPCWPNESLEDLIRIAFPDLWNQYRVEARSGACRK
jgi:hypothetical protein